MSDRASGLELDPERLFRSLFTHMAEGVALHEVVLGDDGTPVNYRILAVNPRYAAMLSLADADVVGRLATEAYGVLEPPYLKEYSRVAVTGEATTFETYFAPMDRHFQISVAPLGPRGFATIFTDITRRRRDQEALRQTQEKLRSIFDFIPAGVTVTDIDGKILDGSAAFCKLAGREREAVVGHTIAELGIWRAPDAFAALMKSLSEREAFGPTDIETTLPAGQPRVMEVRGTSVTLAGQQVALTVAVDVSESRRLERQLVQTQKMESLGVLAGGIAHDFNNLLTGILGNADLARFELPPTSEALVHLADIVKAARRAGDLCRQLLAYSGKGRFVVQPIDVTELVEEMLHLLQVSISKKAVLQLHLVEGLPAVDADATQLRQILMNLVVNASEAIGDRSGVIAVTTGAVQADANYLLDVMGAPDVSPGMYVTLEVSDTGCGIDRDALARIFDPFYTSKFTGRGLGLSAVLGILRGHKGGIKVYSEAGKGSAFKVLLPPSASPARQLGAPPPTPRNWTGSGTILLADDEDTVRALGRRMLEKLGFTVIDVADGREAIETFASRHEEICCVILDLTMPHVDGEACFRELRTLQPDVKVLLSSGYNEQEVISRFVGRGVAGFIQKPYTVGDLVARLRACLEG